MPKILLFYASKHGHTAKIALRLAEALAAEGAGVDLRDAREGDDPSPELYDMVVVGASVHAGHHQRTVVEWCEANAAQLNVRPSAFFSVSLTAADDTDEARETTGKLIHDVLEETRWTPPRTMAFAGALQYREYDVATRVLMRLIMRLGHHPTDASHDYDYTDWGAVDRFGSELMAMLAEAAPRPRAERTPAAGSLA